MTKSLLWFSIGIVAFLPCAAQGQTEVKVPPKVLAEMEFVVGTWEVQGTYRGQDFTGVFSAKWAPGKHCLIMHTKSGAISGTGISGWDPATNAIVETHYRPDGFRIEHRYSQLSESGWEGTVILQDSSGNAKKGTIRVEKGKDKNSFSFTGSVQGDTLITRNRRVQKK